MLQEIAYFMIFGKPLIFYTGVMALAGFSITAFLGFRVMKGKASINTHKKMAVLSLLLALFHGLLGILSQL